MILVFAVVVRDIQIYLNSTGPSDAKTAVPLQRGYVFSLMHLLVILQ